MSSCEDTSKTCPAPWRRTNHQEGYTRANSGQYIAAGYDACTKAMHKSQLPTMWWCGAEQFGFKCIKSFIEEPVLYPTQINNLEDNNKTVVTSNASRRDVCMQSIHIRCPLIPKTHGLADMGATTVLVMADTPMKNVRFASNPLNIKLPDENMVHSICICDVEIPGLPHVLEGHIVPALNVASLIGIRILCKLGWMSGCIYG